MSLTHTHTNTHADITLTEQSGVVIEMRVHEYATFSIKSLFMFMPMLPPGFY